MAKKNGFMQRFIQMTRDLNCELPNQPRQSNGVWDELERVSLVNGRRSFSYRKGWGGGDSQTHLHFLKRNNCFQCFEHRWSCSLLRRAERQRERFRTRSMKASLSGFFKLL